ncbi:Zn-dependent peptidase ImmA, M78 family [Kushneria avicenniae]|uniref:Zn-dependent peptidase ImmA, M78 family n=1 Tax=Kushneria avicenniae TaxID=402385 RepID=A0A1I1JW01_9GAMM|nr:XRE family transcriptional regulator [Kushneria avicenniae]SFC52431.1 Zn-dependent peptidase ImmA, M78 family [Kushneria avicenniae]
MVTTYARINPDILIWARKRSQLSVSALASKLGVPDDKLDAWERAEKSPTFKQAQDFAAKTHIPFGYLYLKQPPEETLPLPDLRTVDGHHHDRPSSELIEMAQIVLRRQEWYAEYLRDQGVKRNPYVGRFTTRSNIHDVVQDMRQVFGIPAYPERGNWEDYWRLLIRKIEEAGILVMRQGFIRHHSRPLSVQEFRGFAISDPLTPVIFVNQADAPAARLFTLIHELAHVWIGKSGVSDGSPDTHQREEVFCNAVAAEFLVPEIEFNVHWKAAGNWKDNLPVLETRFRVSTWVIARRALTLGKISRSDYQAYVDELQERYKNREKTERKIPYYRTQKGQISEAFSKALVSEALSGRVLLRDAGSLLNMKPHRITKYAKELGV